MIAAVGLVLALASTPRCTPVAKDSITGADLAAADPIFDGVPAARVIGYAPAPGRQRIFTAPELKAIAESSGLSISPAVDLCFEWSTWLLSSETAAAAMKEVYPEATIDVVEISRYPAPVGDVVFPRTGLQRVPTAIMLWRGCVPYGQGRKFDVWARVRITVQTDRVVATEVLRPGQVIRDDQVQIDRYSGPPLEAGFAVSAGEVIGRVPRSLIVAGSSIKTANLETPTEIARGDIVNVEVVNGAARISLEARAASSGRLGQSVQLQNQASGKTFRAMVSGTGRAVLVIGGAR